MDASVLAQAGSDREAVRDDDQLPSRHASAVRGRTVAQRHLHRLPPRPAAKTAADAPKPCPATPSFVGWTLILPGPNRTPAMMSSGLLVRPGDHLAVRRGEPTLPLIRLSGQNFFSTLRRKLHWGLEHSDRGGSR